MSRQRSTGAIILCKAMTVNVKKQTKRSVVAELGLTWVTSASKQGKRALIAKSDQNDDGLMQGPGFTEFDSCVTPPTSSDCSFY